MSKLLAKHGLEGFAKIGMSGGMYVVAKFYNPSTKELKSLCVRDYEYADCSRDIDELYYMPINEEVRSQWRHDQNIIQVGDMVQVVKGRKLRIGKVATVKAIKHWHDCYGRCQTTYLYFTDGTRTSIDNCVLV